MKPLIAAEATTFVLIQKVAKNQDKKILPPTGKTPGPALFVGPLPAFNRAYSKYVIARRNDEATSSRLIGKRRGCHSAFTG